MLRQQTPAALLQPGAVGAGELRAGVRETHISVLFFLGDRAYKLRKAVRLGFLDFTTATAREADCVKEIEANRRLAPDVYLGIATFVGEDLEVSHFVVMRRLPEERSLSHLVSSGAPLGGEIRRIAHVLASFHARAARSTPISAAATPEATLRRWQDLFDEVRPYVGTLLEPALDRSIRRRVEDYVAGRHPLLRERISGGHVCDGHGDLQTTDVFCLDDGPRILDCIEFDERLRHVDVMSDVAFLAMDLERIGAVELAGELVETYRELAAESCPPSLVHFYVAERAYVRALVGCLRLPPRGPERYAPGSEPVRRLFRMAGHHLERATVRLVIVGGLPGTGKSTLAAGLADEIGATRLSSDETRRERFGEPTGSEHLGWGAGAYRAEEVAAVYELLLERAGTALQRGESVVLDATWHDDSWRRRARRLAGETSSRLSELCCECPRDLAVERIGCRDAARSLSEATVEVRDEMAARAAPWPSASVVDTSGPPRAALESALARLRSDL